MDLSYLDIHTPDFDAQTYIRILIAIAKADPDNGAPEFAFVRRMARQVGLDYDAFMQNTEKTFDFERQNVSRLTALVVLKDAMMLASLDRNISLPERQRLLAYAEKLDIPRKDMDALETLVNEQRKLTERWKRLVAAH